MIVDDSSFMRKNLKSNLTKAGHLVVGGAKDGTEGFELYKETSPDLVIMDVTMSGTDGIKGASLIKEYDPKANIVFMSLVNDPDVKKQADSLGALAYLDKKDMDGLFQIINGISGQE